MGNDKVLIALIAFAAVVTLGILGTVLWSLTSGVELLV